MSEYVIVGHKNPDVDSILSGYLLCSYLRYKKYDVEYVILDNELEDSVLEVLKSCGVNVLDFPNNILDTSKLILVDHYETHLENEVVAVIDHHPTIREFNYPTYINEKASSTTKHIYDIVNKECPGYISSRFVELVLVGMAVDTLSFRSAKAMPGDKEWFVDMCKKYNLDSNKILRLGDDITKLDDLDKAVLNGLKNYKYGNSHIGTSYINTYGIADEIIYLLIKKLQIKAIDEHLEMWVFIDVNLKNDTTKVYKIYQDKVETEELDFIASRALNVMPKIEKDILKDY
ncbi:MAG: DHH family phosphoesterase [Clostridium sp.]|nr:DHH family phosphoesterase [Clostridium sp.]